MRFILILMFLIQEGSYRAQSTIFYDKTWQRSIEKAIQLNKFDPLEKVLLTKSAIINIATSEEQKSKLLSMYNTGYAMSRDLFDKQMDYHIKRGLKNKKSKVIEMRINGLDNEVSKTIFIRLISGGKNYVLRFRNCFLSGEQVFTTGEIEILVEK